MNKQSIGIFDSGIGGTSIWKEIKKVLPFEDTIYLADSKNAPYGEKSPQEILDLSIKNTEYLLSRNCKIIVVACNTATTNAISYLRSKFDIPFIGIEPAIKPAVLKSTSKKIGILATKGTLSSALFNNTSNAYSKGITIIEQDGEGLVPLIEAGLVNSIETRQLLLKYITPMVEQGIDHLVLGCTHYPYLIPVLKGLMPPHIQIIDSGEAVAKQTKNVLEKYDLLLETGVSTNQLYTNADVAILKTFLKGYTVDVSYLNF
ncbi:glutamate racemase [Cellulophaga sp. HaHaR_3_176]|uniref:glutamate racemase n=1 Tax=Cellulophaga sp. HaHaR_3_176 TaxID=1942464 RepID=UPI001C1FDF26|nr:glutamate racemase [Cellulophaga sp. HaHaR_3_176]QWX84127.1 glutamate racemase [Cellulophaga sp. HaHaR_3_176]